MGYAFAYPVVRKLCRVPVGSYTHYPTIRSASSLVLPCASLTHPRSTDMLRRVQSRQAGHTNTSAVARSYILTHLKLLSVPSPPLPSQS